MVKLLGSDTTMGTKITNKKGKRDTMVEMEEGDLREEMRRPEGPGVPNSITNSEVQNFVSVFSLGGFPCKNTNVMFFYARSWKIFTIKLQPQNTLTNQNLKSEPQYLKVEQSSIFL